MENFKKLPVIALRSMTILPDTMIHFDLIRKKSILAAEQAMSEDQEVFLVTQCHAETEDPQAEDLYQIGCIAKVKQVTKLPDNLVRVLVEGVCRGRLRTLFGEWEWLGGDIEALEVPAMDESRKEAMLRSARDRFTEYCKYYPRTGRTLLRHMEEIRDPGKLMDQIIENIPADYTVKQKILEQVDLESRFEALAEVLATEVEVARIRTDLTEKVRERVDKNQKDYILREQLKYIQEELGEDDASDAALYEEKLQQLKASKEVKEKIAKEISRFKRLSTNSAESGVERAYIETLLELPWDKTSRETSDLTRAEEILDRDHYGLEQVKERLKAVEDLAVASSFITNLELTHIEAQKGKALAAYASMKNIRLDQVMAIGDSENDYSMLSMNLKYTVAMGNAMERIKNTAKCQTRTNAQDGVAYAIENLVLYKEAGRA